MIEEGVMITGEESMQPKDNAERLSAMNSSSIKDKKMTIKNEVLSLKNVLSMAKIKDKMNNKKKEKPVIGAKLKGEFTDQLKAIMNKHNKQVNSHYANDVFSLCAFDVL